MLARHEIPTFLVRRQQVEQQGAEVAVAQVGGNRVVAPAEAAAATTVRKSHDAFCPGRNLQKPAERYVADLDDTFGGHSLEASCRTVVHGVTRSGYAR